MTIAIIVSFFDLRSDLRRLIAELSKTNKVILFVKPEHESLINRHLSNEISYRLINEAKPTLGNFLTTRLFLLFKKLPKSKRNYYLMETFKAHGLTNSKTKKKALSILFLQKLIPHFMSYDFYLNNLRYTSKTDLSGIDAALTFTEIHDDYLYSRLIKSKIPLFTYVYSWDHAFKHVRFSKRIQYLVWHAGISEDLVTMHGIPNNNITVIGSTQLCYLDQFLSTNTSPKHNYKYFYYACGIGIPSHVEDELAIVIQLAKTIHSIYPTYKLIVRPYPNLKNWNIYDLLKNQTNIILEDNYRDQDLVTSEEQIMEKFRVISNAKGFFHMGTTLGLEACFTKCPVFIIATVPKSQYSVSIYDFVYQSQNVKYLIHSSKLNTIASYNQLRETLINIDDPIFLQFSNLIKSQFNTESFELITTKFTNYLSSYNTHHAQ